MLFLRKGPDLIFIESSELKKIEKCLLDKFGGILLNFEKAVELSYENNSIVYLTDLPLDKTDVEKTKSIILIKTSAINLLANIYNSVNRKLINKIKIGPGNIILRYIDTYEDVEKILVSTYNGKLLNFRDAITEGEFDSTIIVLTNKSLTKNLKFSDFNKNTILVPYDSSKIYKELRTDTLLYINYSLKDQEWKEYEITIYDSDEMYRENLLRINRVFSDLDIGIILGEGWTADHPFVMMTIFVYKMKVFSYLEPEELKEIFMGLEYNYKNERIVDIDLYYKKKKVSWTNSKLKKIGKQRENIGKLLREKLLEKLDSETINFLIKIEKEYERKIKKN